MSASSLKQNLSTLRSRVRLEQEEARRTGAAMAGAYVIGSMEKAGTLAELPDAFGLPKTVIIAVLAKVGASFASGQAADYANGVGDAASAIALYQFAKGETIAGSAAPPARGRMSSTVSSLRERLAARLNEGSDELDPELAELEGIHAR